MTVTIPVWLCIWACGVWICNMHDDRDGYGGDIAGCFLALLWTCFVLAACLLWVTLGKA